MTVSRNHQYSDWERQLERLSAYLDNEVDEAERAALERHLPTCEECRDALEELQQTRALLRALPTPVSSRSFLIPETGAIPQAIPRRAAAGTSTLRHVRRARALQWAGGLVAAVGLFMLINSALVGYLHSPTSGASNVSSAGQPAASSSQQPSSIGVATERPTSTFSEGNTHVPTQATRTVLAPTAQNPKTPSAVGTGSAIPLGPVTGLLLLFAGAVLLLSGTYFLRRL